MAEAGRRVAFKAPSLWIYWPFPIAVSIAIAATGVAWVFDVHGALPAYLTFMSVFSLTTIYSNEATKLTFERSLPHLVRRLTRRQLYLLGRWSGYASKSREFRARKRVAAVFLWTSLGIAANCYATSRDVEAVIAGFVTLLSVAMWPMCFPPRRVAFEVAAIPWRLEARGALPPGKRGNAADFDAGRRRPPPHDTPSQEETLQLLETAGGR